MGNSSGLVHVRFYLFLFLCVCVVCGSDLFLSCWYFLFFSWYVGDRCRKDAPGSAVSPSVCAACLANNAVFDSPLLKHG